jgi:hypothetical protein
LLGEFPKLTDIILREAETQAKMLGDDKLDHRALRDPANDVGHGGPAPHFYNQGGFPAIGENFLFESAVTH